MSDRGEYRSIHTVLVDGPDYQALTPHERLMVFVVKMSLGPSGIDVVPSMIGTLCERTGLDASIASDVLDSLEESGWIRRARNILWLVDGLRHEPSLAPTNPKHRKGVLHHVRGLPRIGIVNEYVEAYPEWFDDAAKQSIGYTPSDNNAGMAIDSLSKQEVGSRNEEVGRGKKEPKGAPKPRADKAAPWMSVIRPIYRERYDADPPSRLVKELRPAVTEHGIDEVARRYAIYCARTEGRFHDGGRFVATWGEWDGETAKIGAARAGPDPAAEWYRMLVTHGLLHAGRDQFRATVARLVTEGVIPDETEFIAQCRRVNWPELRNQSAERFAVAYVREHVFNQRSVA